MGKIFWINKVKYRCIDFKTKPRPRSSYSLISLASQTTQIISENIDTVDIDQKVCSSVVPRSRPVVNSRRSPFIKQRLFSTNKNFSQSISAELLNSEDISRHNYYFVDTPTKENVKQIIGAKIYLNETKSVTTSSVWFSGFLEIEKDCLIFTKANKNISKIEKSNVPHICLNITPQLVLSPIKVYIIFLLIKL